MHIILSGRMLVSFLWAPTSWLHICYNSNYGTTWNYPNHTPGDSLRWLTKITKLVFPTSKFTHCKSPLSRRTPNNKGCCSYHQCLCDHDHIPWCFWFSWQPYWNILIAFWVSGKKDQGVSSTRAWGAGGIWSGWGCQMVQRAKNTSISKELTKWWKFSFFPRVKLR